MKNTSVLDFLSFSRNSSSEILSNNFSLWLKRRSHCRPSGAERRSGRTVWESIEDCCSGLEQWAYSNASKKGSRKCAICGRRSQPRSQTCGRRSRRRSQPRSQTCSGRSQPRSQTCGGRSQPRSQTCVRRSQPRSQACGRRSQPRSQTNRECVNDDYIGGDRPGRAEQQERQHGEHRAPAREQGERESQNQGD